MVMACYVDDPMALPRACYQLKESSVMSCSYDGGSLVPDTVILRYMERSMTLG